MPEGTSESGGYEIASTGDTLYLFTYRRVEGAGATALNAADGKVRWTYPIPMGTESASITLADGFVVMDLARGQHPPEKAHQKLMVLNATDGTVARQIDLDEGIGSNSAIPNSLMLVARSP
ncbi:MAG TPA: hypothetical protein VGN88_01900, partial [Phycisphaerae bacterium]